jgi:hypothetical protein
MFSFIGVISLTTGKMVPLLVKRNGNDKEVDYNFLISCIYLNLVKNHITIL